jgi:hypothetical protein
MVPGRVLYPGGAHLGGGGGLRFPSPSVPSVLLGCKRSRRLVARNPSVSGGGGPFGGGGLPDGSISLALLVAPAVCTFERCSQAQG